MKTKESVTVYQCDYCSKKLFRKNAMIHHEQWCNSNPKNMAKCMGCDHLKETVNVVYGDYFGQEYEKSCKSFKCEKLNKILYPAKVIRKGLLDKYPESFEDQELMPTDCEFYFCDFEHI